jgi:hypothetical protein
MDQRLLPCEKRFRTVKDFAGAECLVFNLELPKISARVPFMRTLGGVRVNQL